MSKPAISLCMIVKNEEDCLGRCLGSIAGEVEELIVVDTGSTDRTVEIAQSYGARIVSFPWIGDFAAARNAGLELAGGDWILFLDADEYLEPADQGKLAEYAVRTDADGFFFHIRNSLGGTLQEVVTATVFRMFRNKPEHRFEGRIHEQILNSIHRHNPNPRFVHTGITIHHDGYRKEIVDAKDKANRNMTLILQELAEAPQDPFTLFNAGSEYLRSGQWEQALEALRRARITMSPGASYAPVSYLREIDCLNALGRFGEALELYDAALALYPDYTDLYHGKGSLLMNLGRMKEAADVFRTALRYGKPHARYVTEAGAGTYLTAVLLGTVLEALRDLDQALDCYYYAYRFHPEDRTPLYRMIRILKCVLPESSVPAVLAKRFDLAAEPAFHDIVTALADSDLFEAAWTLTLQFGAERHPELAAALGEKRRILLNPGPGPEAAMPDSLLTQEEMRRLSVKSRYLQGNAADAIERIREWRALETSESGKLAIARTLTDWADDLLESAAAAPSALPHRDILLDARRSLPYADGSPPD